jgi:SAM-dependent methyltransferase
VIEPWTPTVAEWRGLSERLHDFIAEMPWERESILRFVAGAARETAEGSSVLDVGAGDAPYRELFAHTDYRTTDWEQSQHEGAAHVDFVGSAEELPIADAAFDVALCTQVLEHVPEPARVLAELARVLRPGGRLYLSVPLVWELHEMPHDYFRYTSSGIEHLLEATGFVPGEITPRNDCFTTIAQLMRNAGHVMGRAPDGLDERREEAAVLLADLAEQVAALAPLDVSRTMPLGFTADATRSS